MQWCLASGIVFAEVLHASCHWFEGGHDEVVSIAMGDGFILLAIFLGHKFQVHFGTMCKLIHGNDGCIEDTKGGLKGNTFFHGTVNLCRKRFNRIL